MDVPRFQANKVTVPRADPVHILKAGQTAKGSGHYCMSLPSILDDTQDWKLVVDLKGHGKYPNMIQRSWQRPDIVVHAMSICQLILIELMVPHKLKMEGQHMNEVAKYEGLATYLKDDGRRADFESLRWAQYVLSPSSRMMH